MLNYILNIESKVDTLKKSERLANLTVDNLASIVSKFQNQ